MNSNVVDKLVYSNGDCPAVYNAVHDGNVSARYFVRPSNTNDVIKRANVSHQLSFVVKSTDRCLCQ